MVNLPSLRQLQYLVVLHKHQHFSKAAKDCNISQSTLSGAIAHLEEILGCKLLERSHKSFIFTHIGEKVVSDAKIMIQFGLDMLTYTRQQSRPMTGSIVLGCISTIAPFVLGQVAKATHAKYPNLKLQLLESSAENLQHGLLNGSVDMAILSSISKHKGLIETVLAEDQFSLVIHPELMGSLQTNLVKKLPNQSIFILNEQHCLRDQMLSSCKLLERSKLYPFEANSLATLVQMVEIHRGATLLPQMIVNSQLLQNANLLSRCSELHGAHRKVILAWRKSHHCHDTYNKLSIIISEIVKVKCLR